MIEAAASERVLHDALRPWARRLALEALGLWATRGALAGLFVASLVLALGWLMPVPMAELREPALAAGAAVFVLGALLGLRPTSTLSRAGQLDTRLNFADRLATAWMTRQTSQPMTRLQHADALARLRVRSARAEVPIRWRPRDLAGLTVAALCAVVLAFGPTPMRAVLEQQAAQRAAVERAAQRLDALRQDVSAEGALSAEQARRLDELLQQARTDLTSARSPQEAQDVLARAAHQMDQLGNPNATAQEDALGAMTETLSQEPLTVRLADALQRNDRVAAAQAMQAMQAQADQLSDIQRQALSRALQRAANVGRGEPRSAAAMREAARALNSGEPSDSALEATSQAVQDALKSVTAQATLRSTGQRLDELRAAVASGARPEQDSSLPTGSGPRADTPPISEPGPSLAIDPSPGSVQETSPTRGAGQGGADLLGPPGSSSGVAASENVFIPGTPSNGPADQDLVRQPFTVRGQPRPFREVLGQYAQSGRDYVDRASVAPNVRDLVKQYFARLEEGQ